MFSPPSRRLPKPGLLNMDSTGGGRPPSLVNVNVNIVTGPISPPGGQGAPSLLTYQDDPALQQSMIIPPIRQDSKDTWNGREERREADRDTSSQRESQRKVTKAAGPPSSQPKPSTRGIISPEEDRRRLFEECELARGNAQLLSNALVYASPEEVVNGNPVIKVCQSCPMKSDC